MNPWRPTADSSNCRRRGHAHHTKKGFERNFNVVREFRHTALQIERCQLELNIRELLRQEASAWPKKVHGIGDHEIDGNNFNLQNVSWLAVLDPDGASEDVRNL